MRRFVEVEAHSDTYKNERNKPVSIREEECSSPCSKQTAELPVWICKDPCTDPLSPGCLDKVDAWSTFFSFINSVNFGNHRLRCQTDKMLHGVLAAYPHFHLFAWMEAQPLLICLLARASNMRETEGTDGLTAKS